MSYDTTQPAFTVAELARRLQTCERTARRIIETGQLRAHRIRGQWRIREEDFEAYLAETSNRPGGIAA